MANPGWVDHLGTKAGEADVNAAEHLLTTLFPPE